MRAPRADRQSRNSCHARSSEIFSAISRQQPLGQAPQEPNQPLRASRSLQPMRVLDLLISPSLFDLCHRGLEQGSRPGRRDNSSCHQSERYGIAAHGKDDWDFRRCGFCGSYGWHPTGRGDDRHAMASQVGRHVGQPFVLAQSPAVFDRDGLAFDVPFSLRPSRNAATRDANSVGEAPFRNPTTGIGCCARAGSGHAAAAPPRSVMNSRRLMGHTTEAISAISAPCPHAPKATDGRFTAACREVPKPEVEPKTWP